MNVHTNPAALASVGLRSRQDDARKQVTGLDALIRAASAAFPAAERGDLFASPEGKALVNAAYDLFECDSIYRACCAELRRLGEDVEHEIGRGM